MKNNKNIFLQILTTRWFSKNTQSKNTVSKNTTQKNTVTKNTVSKNTVSKNTVTKNTTQKNTVTKNTTQKNTVIKTAVKNFQFFNIYQRVIARIKLNKKLVSDDISAVGLKWLKNYGKVIFAGDGIVHVNGLSDVKSGELIIFLNTQTQGMILNLGINYVGVIIFGDVRSVSAGHVAFRTKKLVGLNVNDFFLGRVITPFGIAVDGLDKITTTHKTKYKLMDIKAPGIIERQSINQPLYTGIKIIDSLIPIGLGQRQLILGDRQTGKTTIAIDTILNQQTLNDIVRPNYTIEDAVINIYIAIGQRRSSVSELHRFLKKNYAFNTTIIILATAADPASLQYLAPYAGCTIGEFYRNKGGNAIVYFDDLSKHAVAYRQLSLLLRRPPGREAYPGDVFYLHSRLLERSAKLSLQNGGGTLTAFPIIETQAGDLSAYIPTNVISITDGQIFLDKELCNQGNMPAINVGLSVSRIGSAAQLKIMKQVVGNLKFTLSEYREVAGLAGFDSDLDPITRFQITRGSRLVELLKQDQYVPMFYIDQILLLFPGIVGLLDTVPLVRIKLFEKQWLKYVNNNFLPYKHLYNKLQPSQTTTLNPELKTNLIKVLTIFIKLYLESTYTFPKTTLGEK